MKGKSRWRETSEREQRAAKRQNRRRSSRGSIVSQARNLRLSATQRNKRRGEKGNRGTVRNFDLSPLSQTRVPRLESRAPSSSSSSKLRVVMGGPIFPLNRLLIPFTLSLSPYLPLLPVSLFTRSLSNWFCQATSSKRV